MSRWAGFKTYQEFCELDGTLQSEIVAEYEAEMQVRAVEVKEAERDADKK